MLALTENARSVIRDLTGQPQIPQGAGLRIAPSPGDESNLQLSLEAEPTPGDHVIDNDGVRIFLEPQTVTLLADQTLDARMADGNAGFYLTAQQD